MTSISQIVPNACATHGLINILMNVTHHPDVDLGEFLRNFQGFSSKLDSQMKGFLVSNSDELYRIHTNYGRPSEVLAIRKQNFSNDVEASGNADDDGIDYESQDPYHFISYIAVEHDGNKEVWKMDGLKTNPTLIATLGGQDGEHWVSKAMADIGDVMASLVDCDVNRFACSADYIAFPAPKTAIFPCSRSARMLSASVSKFRPR